ALPRAVADPRRARLHRPYVHVPAGPQLAVLALGLAAVPRQGTAEPARDPDRARGPARRRHRRAGLVAAPALAAPARGVQRRDPDRLRARADALGLTLSAAVLPLSRDR